MVHSWNPSTQRWKQKAQKFSIILKYMVSLRPAKDTQTSPNKPKHAGEMPRWVKCFPHNSEDLSLNAQSYIKPGRSNMSLLPVILLGDERCEQELLWKILSLLGCCTQQLTARRPYLKKGGR